MQHPKSCHTKYLLNKNTKTYFLPCNSFYWKGYYSMEATKSTRVWMSGACQLQQERLIQNWRWYSFATKESLFLCVPDRMSWSYTQYLHSENGSLIFISAKVYRPYFADYSLSKFLGRKLKDITYLWSTANTFDWIMLKEGEGKGQW